MADGSIARRYAKALVSIGEEQSKLDSFGSDLSLFVELMDNGESELYNAVINPGLALSDRRSVLDAVLAKLGLDITVGNFLRLLVDKSRFNMLLDISREYGSMQDDIEGRVRVTVTTPSKATAAMKSTVEKTLADSTGKTVVVEYAENPAIIGGMVIKIGHTLYDSSVSSQLNQIQQALSAAGAAAEA